MSHATSAGPDLTRPDLSGEAIRLARLVHAALRQGPTGEYQLQDAIAGLHAEAPSHEATDWPRLLALYERLERVTDNPVVTLNRAAGTGNLREQHYLTTRAARLVSPGE